MSAEYPGAERQAVASQEGWILGGKGHVVLFYYPFGFHGSGVASLPL